MLPRPQALVTLLTDFGLRDPYVGLMKGAVLRGNPKATIVDLGHEVPPQDVTAGSFWLAAAIGQFPPGTVHVAVIDPGVGTSRRLLAMAAHECYWLAPDNGLLGLVCAQDPNAEVRAIDADQLGLRPRSRTFHGRDVLAPVAGWLTGGRYGFTSLGPRVAEPLAGESPFEGPARVVHVDAFGNLITNVAATALANVRAVRLGGRVVPLLGTYAEAAPGDLLALVSSFDRLEVAQNGGNAARTLGLSRGAPIELVEA